MPKDTPAQVTQPGQASMSMPAPVPLVPAPVGAPVLTFGPTPNQMGVDTFSEEQELCGCCDDGETCCLAFFCGCCAHGMLCHDIQEQGYTEHCLIWLVATMCIGGCAPPLLGTAARVRLRDKYGLHGSKLRDFLLHFCCHPCATAQELRFLKSLGRLHLARDGAPLYQAVPSGHDASPPPVGTHARLHQFAVDCGRGGVATYESW